MGNSSVWGSDRVVVDEGLWRVDDDWAPDPLAPSVPASGTHVGVDGRASTAGLVLFVAYGVALLGAYAVLTALLGQDPDPLSSPSWWVQAVALVLGLLSVGSVIAAGVVFGLGLHGSRATEPRQRVLGVVVTVLGAVAVPSSFWVLYTGGAIAMAAFSGS